MLYDDFSYTMANYPPGWRSGFRHFFSPSCFTFRRKCIKPVSQVFFWNGWPDFFCKISRLWNYFDKTFLVRYIFPLVLLLTPCCKSAIAFYVSYYYNPGGRQEIHFQEHQKNLSTSSSLLRYKMWKHIDWFVNNKIFI